MKKTFALSCLDLNIDLILASKANAVEIMMNLIEEHNEGLYSDDENYLTPFDFTLDEIVSEETYEGIKTYEEARQSVGGKPDNGFVLLYEDSLDDDKRAEFCDYVQRLVKEVNPKHVRALIAYNRLCTIAQAWNKADGFEPDFSNKKQQKWSPWFMYCKNAGKFLCADATVTASYADATAGSRLCFKTPERARQFGNEFIHLWNIFLLFK